MNILLKHGRIDYFDKKDIFMSREYRLSFCIPEYNNSDVAYMLVTQLLSCTNTEFQVVVSDDCSIDDTVARLKRIDDSRLKIVVNKERMGAKKNWLNALKSGDGEYLYLVMGRDYLNVRKIDNLIRILKKCSDEELGLMMDRREKLDVCIYKGIEAAKIFLFPDHPTGMIVRRETFFKITDIDEYFFKDFSYPETYVKRDILIKYGKAAILNSGVFVNKVNINYSLKKSEFEHDCKDKFFYPSKRIMEFNEFIEMVKEWSIIEGELFNEFFVEKFKFLLEEVTGIFREYCEDYETSAHYGLKKRFVQEKEIIDNIDSVYEAVKNKYKLSLSLETEVGCIVKEYYNKYYNKNDILYNNYKNTSMIKVLNRFLFLKRNSVNISDYLKQYNYKTIAIYGFSILGENIYNELKNNNVKVSFIIDRNWKKLYAEIPIVSLDFDTPKVDICIITPIGETDMIKENLLKMGICKICISVEDMLFLSPNGKITCGEGEN